MKTSVLIAGLTILITAGAALAMGDLYVSGEYRYRITVEVETPEGIKSGSAVRAVKDHASGVKIIDLPGVAGSSPEVRGEAVVVDLGEKGRVFGLISWDSYREVYAAFPFSDAEKAGDGLRYYLSLEPGTSASLPKEQWPKFVTFTDMNDPKSVMLVWGSTFNKKAQEYELVDRIEELFGEGVKIKDVTLEITDEPVTWGVVGEYLPNGFKVEITDRWRELSIKERQRLYGLTRFRQGEKK